MNPSSRQLKPLTLLAAGFCLFGLAAAPAAQASQGALQTTSPKASSLTPSVVLDGVRVDLSPGTTQVVTVNRTSGYHARATIWRYLDGRWIERYRSKDARIGYGGLVEGSRRRQGTGTTPLGTYPLLFTFGTANAHRSSSWRNWDLPHKKTGAGDYWVEDNESSYYNRFRSRSSGGFRWWLDPNSVNGSERLVDYPTQYRMAVVIGFNYDNPVRYRGAGIFMHVNGRGATSGCVSAGYWFMYSLMARLDPSLHPVIAIGA